MSIESTVPTAAATHAATPGAHLTLWRRLAAGYTWFQAALLIVFAVLVDALESLDAGIAEREPVDTNSWVIVVTAVVLAIMGVFVWRQRTPRSAFASMVVLLIIGNGALLVAGAAASATGVTAGIMTVALFAPGALFAVMALRAFRAAGRGAASEA